MFSFLETCLGAMPIRSLTVGELCERDEFEVLNPDHQGGDHDFKCLLTIA